MQKGSIFIIAVLIILGVLVAGVASYKVANRQAIAPEKDSSTIIPIPKFFAPKASEEEKESLSDWKSYSSKVYGFELKYPSDWSIDTSYSYETESLVSLEVISTLRLEEQMDPMKKISQFTIIASTKDLKTDSDFGRWLEDYTGQQKQSQVTLKGIPAEKYTDETPMPGGDYRSERYYFKKGGTYFLISAGIYITPDLKEKNEKILQNILDSLQFD